MAGISQVTNSQPVKGLGGNSTTTAVTAASPFTGSWVEVPVGSMLYVVAYSDADIDITIEYSVDGGTNVDSTLTRYYRTGLINAPYDFKNARPFVRVSASVSGATDATETRINAYVASGEPLLNIPVDATMAQNYGAISVRPTDFHAEVALGRRQGVSLWNKFGYNDDVDAGTEVIASFGGTFQYLTAGETIDIVSTSTADDLVGTGVQRIVVYGVDENWDEQVEVVEMDGTTTVTTTSQWIGINRIAIFKAGSGAVNAGDITVSATTSGYNMAHMPAGDGVTQQLIYYVPRSHQFLAEWLHFDAIKTSGGGNPELIYKGWVYSDVNTAKQEVYRGKVDTQSVNNLDVSPPLPFPVGEKSILWFEVTTDTANTQVSGRFSGELVRDVDA